MHKYNKFKYEFLILVVIHIKNCFLNKVSYCEGFELFLVVHLLFSFVKPKYLRTNSISTRILLQYNGTAEY